MYCRDGCRCEQQYRLHRLLAYDPNNECRGIFSDWFKFPSCCICRCYDLPVEFRVTSRSPRLVHQRQRLKVRAPRAPSRQRHHWTKRRELFFLIDTIELVLKIFRRLLLHVEAGLSVSTFSVLLILDIRKIFFTAVQCTRIDIYY